MRYPTAGYVTRIVRFHNETSHIRTLIEIDASTMGLLGLILAVVGV